MRIAIVSLVVCAGLLWCGVPNQSDGCAAPHRDGEYVHIAEESAVIVWDAPSKTQHFIRRATFDTKAKDFGFLVPTPTQPKLADANNAIFTFLEQAIRPRVVYVSGGFDFRPLCCCIMPMASRAPDEVNAPAGVRVLDAQRVGDFDAVVLEADSATALNDWLKEHGYPSDPELVSWLGPYITEKWKISAFKIVPSEKGQARVQTKAVRMSFQTDKPYFPYREPRQPDDEKNAEFQRGPRMLRVFFVSAGRTAAKRGPTAWSARTAWADTLDDVQRARLVNDLGVPAEHVPAGAWLTTFEDTASPRPATDEVYFESSSEQTPIRPPDIQRRGPPTHIPADLVALGVLFVGAFALLIVLYIRKHR